MVDINPRPQKRLRTTQISSTLSHQRCCSSASVPLSRPPLSPGLKPLPPHVLLLALPALLLHPPTHEQYAFQYGCVCNCQLWPPDVECYAWTALAEVGMRAIRSEHDWTMGLEEEHPILRHLRHHLSLLNAHFAFWRSNTRFPRAVLRRLISTFLTSSPPASPFSHGKGADSSVSIQPHTNPPEVQAALTALINLSAIAAQHQHFSMLKLVAVLRLRVLVAAEMWDMVGDALEGAEKLLSLVFDDGNSTKEGGQEHCSVAVKASDRDAEEDPLTAALTVHTLMLGIVYHTHGGPVAPVGGVGSDGLVEVPLSPCPPIHLRVSHPRVIFLLTFLISAVAKRDPVGRRPKKKVFAESGIVQCKAGCDEDGRSGIEINVPPWSSHGDVENIDQSTLRIEADLLCELAAVRVLSCQLNYLDTVVAHTRTHGFFSEYAPRYNAPLCPPRPRLGDTHRAGTCYRVAAYVAGAGPVGAARCKYGAGEALLRIGLVAKRAAPNMASDSPVVMGEESHAPYLDESTIALTKDAIARCSASASAPLPALAELLSAALSPSQIIRSKSLLKHALALSGSAGDNHMRALVLAVVGAQYVHTAPEHAMEVLAVCETLGAGMGASEKKPAGTESEPSVCGVGNAALRLWVGERFLELFKRAGKEKRVQKQGEF
ncbi:hypothetical protein BKA82DRAFT_4236410 [Pisolithus tinctorius]|nr:hypothetical protein BKA82DRAFT_4236410 [Pisolithus tinctorius]